MNGLRLVHNTAPEQIPDVENLPGFGNAKSKWLKARSDLVNQVRAELDFKRPRRWRRRSWIVEALTRGRTRGSATAS
jgi:hypothetical protein